MRYSSDVVERNSRLLVVLVEVDDVTEMMPPQVLPNQLLRARYVELAIG
jgi:hypothetical protein